MRLGDLRYTGGTKDKPEKRNQPTHGCSCRNDNAAAVKDQSVTNYIRVSESFAAGGDIFLLIWYVQPCKDVIKATFTCKVISSLGPCGVLGLAHVSPDK